MGLTSRHYTIPDKAVSYLITVFPGVQEMSLFLFVLLTASEIVIELLIFGDRLNGVTVCLLCPPKPVKTNKNECCK